MACDDPGSWANYAAGLGVAGPVMGATLDALVAFYRERRRAPRVQVTPYQHPSLMRGLSDRGFVVYEVETVLWRGLEAIRAAAPIPGLAYRAVDPSSPPDVAAFVDAQLAGFFGDREPPPAMRPITARVARSARCRLWLLDYEGQVVGCGGLEMFEGSAVLIGGCVHTSARRRGLHSAFIGFRLREAARAGASYVTVGSTPGGPTERNALRAGFVPAYTQLGLCLRP